MAVPVIAVSEVTSSEMASMLVSGASRSKVKVSVTVVPVLISLSIARALIA